MWLQLSPGWRAAQGGCAWQLSLAVDLALLAWQLWKVPHNLITLVRFAMTLAVLPQGVDPSQGAAVGGYVAGLQERPRRQQLGPARGPVWGPPLSRQPLERCGACVWCAWSAGSECSSQEDACAGLSRVKAACLSLTPGGLPRAVTFFGRHKMRESLGVMGAFWASIAGSLAWPCIRCLLRPAQWPGSGLQAHIALQWVTGGTSGAVRTKSCATVAPRPAGTIAAFSQVSPLAAWLMAPTQV